MKLAIMQPYFFPYLGYFALIKHSDNFIVFDGSQFIRHGWIERNRIIRQQGGTQYIKVPLMNKSRSTLIKDVLINNNENWKEKIIAQLTIYKKIAPYYRETLELINHCFENDFSKITYLNTFLLKEICEYLQISFHYTIFSEMNLELKPVAAPDEWALNISLALNADTYINAPGGKSFFNREKYKHHNIDLKFLEINVRKYKQLNSESFEPNLSIVDVMMFKTPNEINDMLNDINFSK
jgi:hypothetical protein